MRQVAASQLQDLLLLAASSVNCGHFTHFFSSFSSFFETRSCSVVQDGLELSSVAPDWSQTLGNPLDLVSQMQGFVSLCSAFLYLGVQLWRGDLASHNDKRESEAQLSDLEWLLQWKGSIISGHQINPKKKICIIFNSMYKYPCPSIYAGACRWDWDKCLPHEKIPRAENITPWHNAFLTYARSWVWFSVPKKSLQEFCLILLGLWKRLISIKVYIRRD